MPSHIDRHPARHAVPTKHLLPLLETWDSRANALEKAAPGDPGALAYNIAASELREMIRETRSQYADMLKKAKDAAARIEQQDRKAAAWAAQEARKLWAAHEQHLENAFVHRQRGNHLAAKEHDAAADNARHAARRAAAAVEAICAHGDLDPKEFL